MKVIPPLEIRKLRADMELKALSLRDVAQKAKVPYSTASMVLAGRLVSPVNLKKIIAVIQKAPMPKEVAA